MQQLLTLTGASLSAAIFSLGFGVFSSALAEAERRYAVAPETLGLPPTGETCEMSNRTQQQLGITAASGVSEEAIRSVIAVADCTNRTGFEILGSFENHVGGAAMVFASVRHGGETLVQQFFLNEFVGDRYSIEFFDQGTPHEVFQALMMDGWTSNDITMLSAALNLDAEVSAKTTTVAVADENFPGPFVTVGAFFPDYTRPGITCSEGWANIDFSRNVDQGALSTFEVEALKALSACLSIADPSPNANYVFVQNVFTQGLTTWAIVSLPNSDQTSIVKFARHEHAYALIDQDSWVAPLGEAFLTMLNVEGMSVDQAAQLISRLRWVTDSFLVVGEPSEEMRELMTLAHVSQRRTLGEPVSLELVTFEDDSFLYAVKRTAENYGTDVIFVLRAPQGPLVTEAIPQIALEIELDENAKEFLRNQFSIVGMTLANGLIRLDQVL
jgi:hypothetical protein